MNPDERAAEAARLADSRPVYDTDQTFLTEMELEELITAARSIAHSLAAIAAALTDDRSTA